MWSVSISHVMKWIMKRTLIVFSVIAPFMYLVKIVGGISAIPVISRIAANVLYLMVELLMII